MNTILNVSVVTQSTNKSGGALAYGDVVIPSSAGDLAVATTTDIAYRGPVGVVIDPGGITTDEIGAIVWQGYCPRINLLSAAARTDGLVVSASAGKATISASSSSDIFGLALTAGATPEALLISRFPAFSANTNSPLAGDLLRYDGTEWVNVAGDISVRLVKSGTQAVGPGGTVTVAWETEEYDTADMHAGANPERITIPVDGKYLVIAGVNFDSNSVVAATLRVDGTTEIARNSQGNSAVTEGVSVVTVKDFIAGQYIEVRFYAGNNGNIVVANTHFEASLLCRV